jgi:DNA-binding Lrp family transcriptional regulator
MAVRRVNSHCIFDEMPGMFRRFAEPIGQMDELDTRLIDLLRENARAPTAQLARSLRVSRTTLQSRLERLERTGVIAGYTVRLSEALERGEIHAYVLMTVSPKQSAAVVAGVRKLPGVRLLQSASGPYDLIAKATAPGVKEMDALIDALGALPGVERTTSSIVLSTKIDR